MGVWWGVGQVVWALAVGACVCVCVWVGGCGYVLIVLEMCFDPVDTRGLIQTPPPHRKKEQVHARIHICTLIHTYMHTITLTRTPCRQPQQWMGTLRLAARLPCYALCPGTTPSKR